MLCVSLYQFGEVALPVAPSLSLSSCLALALSTLPFFPTTSSTPFNMSRLALMKEHALPLPRPRGHDAAVLAATWASMLSFCSRGWTSATCPCRMITANNSYPVSNRYGQAVAPNVKLIATSKVHLTLPRSLDQECEPLLAQSWTRCGLAYSTRRWLVATWVCGPSSESRFDPRPRDVACIEHVHVITMGLFDYTVYPEIWHLVYGQHAACNFHSIFTTRQALHPAAINTRAQWRR